MVENPQCFINQYDSGGRLNIHQITWLQYYTEIKNVIEILKLKHNAVCALISSSAQFKEKKKYLNLAEEIQNKILKLLMPWVAESKKENDLFNIMKNQWEKIFGNINDSKTQDLIKKSIEALRNVNNETRNKGSVNIKNSKKL